MSVRIIPRSDDFIEAFIDCDCGVNRHITCRKGSGLCTQRDRCSSCGKPYPAQDQKDLIVAGFLKSIECPMVCQAAGE